MWDLNLHQLKNHYSRACCISAKIGATNMFQKHIMHKEPSLTSCSNSTQLEKTTLMFFSSLVPDRQYEVKVWAFNKQTEGAAAVWMGRTDKPHDRRENQCLSAENVFRKTKQCKNRKIILPIFFVHVQHLRPPCALLRCPRAASRRWPTAPPPSGCAGKNLASVTCASSTTRCAAARREPPTPLWSRITAGQNSSKL